MVKSKCLIKNAKGKCAKKVEIWGKRWFQKSYGNTYHNVRVYVDDELVGESGEEYGYGNQYVQTAFELLQKKGLAPNTGKYLASGHKADYNDFMTDKMNHRNKYLIHVNDVPREMDLQWRSY